MDPLSHPPTWMKTAVKTIWIPCDPRFEIIMLPPVPGGLSRKGARGKACSQSNGSNSRNSMRGETRSPIHF
jgi:hypothetical protein